MSPFEALIAANAPYWGAEAEICRTYFESDRRDRDSDLQWLERQAAKELFDGVAVRTAQVEAALADRSRFETARLVTLTEELHEEANHLAAFVRAHEIIGGPDAPELTVDRLEAAVNWADNVALRELRAHHAGRFGPLGACAALLSEGGYCTLFAEGMRRRGCGPADDAIADACALVYDDEFDHMVGGIAGLATSPMTDGDWVQVTALAVEQGRQRLLMRNAQFGHPVEPTRMEQLVSGAGTPVEFDWEAASRVLEQRAP